MKQFKRIQKRSIIFTILRFLVPILAIAACFLITFLMGNDTSSFLLTLVLAILAVSAYMYFTNKVKTNQLILEDLIFSEAIKGIFDKKKTVNAASYLSINELVRNNILVEPYRRYGFLYFEAVYNKVVINGSNITLEYLENKGKKRKKTYYGFVGRAFRYELRSHKPLYLINKNSSFFNVSESIAADDTFLVSGNLQNYERLVNKGSLTKLKDYIKNKDLNLSVFYLNEAIYVLIEKKVVTINPKLTQKIDDNYINQIKVDLRIPREIADILNITK